ncbi:acyl carrier protein [Streptomyces olivaceus]|uniref:acyl carrier protein n=1 Tax=Streptomyces olivaceus TaxID=47716 RepID=UPI001CCB6873|nr:acyl carrier protein [Streptomyces olivaceus]MBZ6288446.1 acyl carrier protein [Streptomyces olivaceus]
MTTDDLDLAAAADRLEALICEIGHISADDPSFGRRVNLFQAGYADSLATLQVIAQVESDFGIELTEEDLFDPRFGTIDGITAVAGERRAASVVAHPPGKD